MLPVSCRRALVQIINGPLAFHQRSSPAENTVPTTQARLRIAAEFCHLLENEPIFSDQFLTDFAKAEAFGPRSNDMD